MAPVIERVEAIVLRSMRYGESDSILHLFSLEEGRTSAIAKGARGSKSRLGARAEPFTRVALQLRRGRGDLAIVAGVDMLASHQRVRESYKLQQVAASALHTLDKLTHGQSLDEAAFHLTCNFLLMLDGERVAALEPGETERVVSALLVAYRLKLLHAGGLSPQLTACARCGGVDSISGWSAADGGVVCSSCHSGRDSPLELHVLDAAAWLLTTALPAVVEAGADSRPSAAAVGSADRTIAGSLCSEHAGFRIREPFA